MSNKYHFLIIFIYLSILSCNLNDIDYKDPSTTNNPKITPKLDDNTEPIEGISDENTKKDSNKRTKGDNKNTKGISDESTKGDSDESTKGNSNESTKGNSNKSTKGNSNDNTKRDINESTKGDNKKNTKGNNNDNTKGNSNDITIPVNNSTSSIKPDTKEISSIFDLAEKSNPKTLKQLFTIFDKHTLLNLRNHKGATLLHKAAGGKNYDNLKFLLEEGANPDVAGLITKNDPKAYTPIGICLISQDIKRLKLLLKHKADISFPDGRNYTAFHILLLNRYYSNQKGKDMIDLLVKNKKATKAINHKGGRLHDRTPLHIAAKYPGYHVEDYHYVIKTLLKVRGINYNLKDQFGNTAAHIAIRSISHSEVGQIINKDKLTDKETKRVEIAELLLKNTDPKLINNKGNNILHEAVYSSVTKQESSGYKGIIKMILKKFPNQNFNTKNNDGHTPTDLAEILADKTKYDQLPDEYQYNTPLEDTKIADLLRKHFKLDQ